VIWTTRPTITGPAVAFAFRARPSYKQKKVIETLKNIHSIKQNTWKTEKVTRTESSIGFVMWE